jgi:type II secretory pathway pseudopilin PulG
MIALGLVAILTAAAIPYLYDSFASGEGDRLSVAITERVSSERTRALQSGKDSRLTLRTNSFAGTPLPVGWTLQVRGLNDSAFRDPGRDRTWTINAAGICEPLTLRLGNGTRQLVLSFDPLTGQVLPDDHD